MVHLIVILNCKPKVQDYTVTVVTVLNHRDITLMSGKNSAGTCKHWAELTLEPV